MDAELIEDEEYQSFGESAVERVKALLGRLDSIETTKRRDYELREKGKETFHKFMERIECIFSSLPSPKKWRAFYLNDLPLITDIDPTLRDWAIANRLNKSQTKAFNKLKGVVVRNALRSPTSHSEPFSCLSSR